MDRSNDILSRGINSANNFLNQLQEEEWNNEDIKKTFITTSKIIFKLGIFAVREVGYFFTGIFTLPKERCIISENTILEDRNPLKLQKLAKVAYPIIFGALTYFYWNSPLAVPFTLAIVMPSAMFYSALMITKGVIKLADWIFPLGNE